MMHEEGYEVERRPDGELRFRRPHGRLMPDVPDRPAILHDPVQELCARHTAQGRRLHASAARPGWLGERLDVGWAIDVLHPLAATDFVAETCIEPTHHRENDRTAVLCSAECLHPWHSPPWRRQAIWPAPWW